MLICSRERLWDKNLNVLEIGVFEGRSSLFFLSVLKATSLTVIDPWDPLLYRDSIEGVNVEQRFDFNCAVYKDRIQKFHKVSSAAFPQLLDSGKTFDIIYVDGAHFADQVYEDAINAWQLLNDDGLLFLDDFAWAEYAVKESPAFAINRFLREFAGQYKMLWLCTQVVLKKVSANT